MSISSDNTRLTVIISKEVKAELKKIADSNNRSVSNYVSNLLEQHVKENN